MRLRRAVVAFGVFILGILFFSLPSVVMAEEKDVGIDVKDPFTVSCAVAGEHTQVVVRAHDTITNIDVRGFRPPVDALRAGWSITFSKEGVLKHVVVRAMWRGQLVERAANCK